MSVIPPAITRVFLESFTARDIAEPLLSFDAEATCNSVGAVLQRRRVPVAGVREEGHIVGCVRADSLKGDTCGACRKPFPEGDVLEDTAPLLRVLRILGTSDVVLVRSLGTVTGFITRADLLKPPFRMWLFGIVTMIEMRFTDLIDRHCGDDWTAHVSPNRLEKARGLLSERKRRGQSPRLLDCLQFADKGQLVARIESLRSQTIFPSRRQAETAIRRLEQLRNNLAHSQDIITGDWETIAEICQVMEHMFGSTR